MKNTCGTMILTSVMAWVSFAEAKPVPVWDQVINNPGRFKVLADFNDEAVLDKETGLVWEKSPDRTEVKDWGVFPGGAVYKCYQRIVGGRMGWRLPTAEEIYSLMDPSQMSPALPTGHPFMNVQASPLHVFYWTGTTSAHSPLYAIAVEFETVPNIATLLKTGGFALVWCVRGGHGHDGQ